MDFHLHVAQCPYTTDHDSNRTGCRVPGEGPWHKRCTPTFGLLFKHELIAAIFARFQPHLPLVLVTQYGSTRLEPYREEWGKPKGAREPVAT